MADRKYITELQLILASKGTMLLHPSQISELHKLDDDERDLAECCHIYLIVRRPRLGFVEGSLSTLNERTKGEFFYFKSGIRAEVEFEFTNTHDVEFSISGYPHRYLIARRKDGDERIFAAHLVSFMCEGISEPQLRDLEVVYVGMSYGEGDRAAADRLRSHSTLQQVLADMNADAPDDEALIIMVEYDDPFLMIAIDGANKTLPEDGDRDVVADIRQVRQHIDKKIETSLAEAALIRYFRPKYNEKYKLNFPDIRHSILSRLYEVDIVSLAVEINTEDLRARLLSSSRSAGYHHIASYDLHDPEIRQSFYSIFDSEITAQSQSGPVF